MPTSVPNFNFLALIVSEIKRVSPNLMWGLLRPCRTPYAETFTYAPSTWQGTQPNFSVVSLCIMQLCEYVFPIGFPLYVLKNVFGGFEGEDVKIMCSNPQRHYPAWIRVCWCIACQNRFNGLRSVERFCVQKKLKKLGGNFGYMGRSNPLGDLHQMWHMGRYGEHNHVCNISWLWVWWEE